MVIAAVAVGAAVVGAGATAYAGSKEAGATKSAANTAAAEQQQALSSQQQLAAPYVAQGQQGIQTYNALTSPNRTPAQIQATLASTPGYQATYTQGVEGAERAAASSGLNLSGNQLTGVEQFGAQLGDATYQQAIANAVGQEGIGQAAAAGQAANIGQAASNEGQIAINQGTNIANIDANEIAGITKATSSAGNTALTYNTLQGLNNSPYGGGVSYGAPSNPNVNVNNYNNPTLAYPDG